MEERYIQLPPLPADMEVQALELLWQFAILGEEEQKEALEYIKTIDDYYEDDTDLESLKEHLKKFENDRVSEEFQEFIQVVKRLVGRMIRDSYGLARLFYQKRCIEHKDVDEISKECGLAPDKIQVFVDYFDVQEETEENSAV